ncbi:Reverse transcriptase domain [Arabidopsis suecica]|uniref:Reverse transcriptase domain n=1 Tax=Arabidopsis suecica TaxID=45249 RepID=A0A8T2B1Q6_ARASU|nr:Reverse transcriptase domain [Arabidopsis suecica]
MEDFRPTVDAFWKDTEPLFLSTSTLFRFTKKLKALKPVIRNLAKDRLGNLVKKAKEAHDDLCKKQEQNLANPSPLAMTEELEAYNRWDLVSGLEEKYLKQKSKLHWLDVGDRNNKTFHRAVMVREAQNSIRELHKQDGTVVKKPEEIKAEAEKFFREFLQHVPHDYEEQSVNELQDLLLFRCSEEDSLSLTCPVTDEEIKKSLFAMPNDKSPGPDGYTAEFYKSAWETIGGEFTLAVQSFFVKGFLPKGVNSTILALIPKKLEAREMKDYRPISCCNVIYKVISKIIANRLKRVLPKFIAGNQSAFVQDRLLIENVLLATELVKDYHKDSLSSRCAIKIDISKAFDSVQWSFLRNVLLALNFPHEFIHWIMLCITTASFSVQVNGELAGYFNSSRGLRQGCSLSPYLFVISMDVLSKMLDKAAGLRRFGFHPKCKNIGLTHLSFADDLMILSDGKVRSVEGIVEVFNEFAACSGLKISMEKSTVYLAGVTDSTYQAIVDRFPFEVGTLPVRYLGLPLVTKRLSSADYLPLIEQIKKKIGSWTARWTEANLLKQVSFWAIKATTSLGSWIWKKILKYREVAKSLSKHEVRNGALTSFWYDNWSGMGRLAEVVGDRGIIDMGISRHATVLEAWTDRRRRRHRAPLLNRMEEELVLKQNNQKQDTDMVLWKGNNGVFKTSFSTKDTWNHTRTTSNKVAWYKGVWFAKATPKHAFCVWLAVQNRLSTGDRMSHWNSGVDATCVLCNNALETRNHLFFSCGFAAEIWEALAKNIYKSRYTTDWHTTIEWASHQWQNRIESFLARSILHVATYTIWRERNGRKHGNIPNPPSCLIKWCDKHIRNQLSAIKISGDRRYDSGLQAWFDLRGF